MSEELVVKDLKKWFPERGGFFSKKTGFVKAVDGVSFDIVKGEVLCLAGESGCGKTTTGRVVLRLIEPTSGHVYLHGVDIFELNKRELREMRPEMQMIFQDPYESLDPRMDIFSILAEPLEVNRAASGYRETMERVEKVLNDVRLVPIREFIRRFPHELSGGQRQRVAIARALMLNPRFMVADEPVSMLDASIRTEILNLLKDLRDKYDLTFLYITHDIAQARYVGEKIMIMYLGRVVERGPIEDVIMDPIHPYTKALISNVPIPDPTADRERIMIKGETPTPIDLPEGCRFHPRCREAGTACKEEEPELIKIGPERWVACHKALR
ncbi:MAG: ABC transporter ATP-binding protein [Candidatus Bathyarchaeota archaeon]|nr:ABC transporter ATP-binding protein [Candidatus Bathyarchaeota archaeon]